MGGKGSGRKPKYNDLYHKLVREHQQEYTENNREAWNLAMREKIPVKEARKMVEQQKKEKQ